MKCCGALVTFDCSYDGFGIVKMKMFLSTTTLAKVGPHCHFVVLFLSVQTHAVTLKKDAAVFKVWSIPMEVARLFAHRTKRSEVLKVGTIV